MCYIMAAYFIRSTRHKRTAMTSRLIYQARDAKIPGKFPDFPPRDDMNNPLYLYRQGYMTTLHRHFGFLDTTLVLSETPLGWRHSQRRGILIPDLIIAFDVDVVAVIAQRGYAIEEQGKPPDFVLEVASESTARRDEIRKRTGYQAYGVQEYWRFDHSGGQYHRQHLAGDTLIDGVYRPITIVRSDETHYWGRSGVLGLSLCWENGYLRWWDPATQRYLETHQEEAEARIAAEARADSAEARVRELEAELEHRQQF